MEPQSVGVTVMEKQPRSDKRQECSAHGSGGWKSRSILTLCLQGVTFGLIASSLAMSSGNKRVRARTIMPTPLEGSHLDSNRTCPSPASSHYHIKVEILAYGVGCTFR